MKIGLKEEILIDIEHSLNKLHLNNNNILECIFQIIMNEGAIISKEKLNKIYKFIILKYITIIPQNQNDETIFTYNNENTDYIIKYSFPILKEVFNQLLKIKKKIENRKALLFAEGSEEGIILEKLIYLSLDKNEICFEEKINIENSIEVNQLFECSQLYIDPYDFKQYKTKENIIELEEEDIFKNLFQYGKNYHIYLHNKIGKAFDGGLLIGKNNRKSFDLLIYQATKKKDTRKRLTNNDICECKDMIKNNIEISFDIKIDKVSFAYIMEYENQDSGLIEHCNSFENQLNYFFYSYEEDKFVNKRGKEIKIKQFLKDIKPLQNYIICMPKNKGRDLEAIKDIIDNIPSDMELNENNLLGKKTNREEIKDFGNFMELYSKNEKKILTLTSKEKNHDETLKANRIKFFSRYTDILDKSKNKQENKVSIRKKYKNKRKNVDKKVIKTHFKTEKKKEM